MASGEDSILNLLGKYFPNSHPHMLMGRGDDCALMRIMPATCAMPPINLLSMVPSMNLAESPTTVSLNSANLAESPTTVSLNSANLAESPTAVSLNSASLAESPTSPTRLSSVTLPMPLALQEMNGLDTNTNLMAVSSDIFACDVHFRHAYFSPAAIGHKALAVNISDLAACGARPYGFVLNLTLTDREDFLWLEEFFSSMSSLANEYGMVLCGGDLAKIPASDISQSSATSPTSQSSATSPTSAAGLNIGITVFGDYSHGGLPLLRHTHNGNSAKEGDIIFLVGHIGLARLGFMGLEKNIEEETTFSTQFPRGTKAHLYPTPLVQEGLLLSHMAKETPIYLMDVSDGLMRDVPRLLARQGIVAENIKPLSAILSIDEKMLDEEIILYCKQNSLDAVNFAYQGGEDYSLLGICSTDRWLDIQTKWQQNTLLASLQKIGVISQMNVSSLLTLNGQSVSESGFDHFKR